MYYYVVLYSSMWWDGEIAACVQDTGAEVEERRARTKEEEALRDEKSKSLSQRFETTTAVAAALRHFLMGKRACL